MAAGGSVVASPFIWMGALPPWFRAPDGQNSTRGSGSGTKARLGR